MRNRPKGSKRCEESPAGPWDARCGEANATERQINSHGSGKGTVDKLKDARARPRKLRL
jgi:hypothetical protein